VVPRQGWSPCPAQKGTGNRIRYHPVTPQTFAPPRGTTCTTCTTKGERTGGAYLKPLAAAGEAEEHRGVVHGAGEATPPHGAVESRRLGLRRGGCHTAGKHERGF
jgi:hypothetical protein